MSGNPFGYGEVVYDRPAEPKKEDKTPFSKGDLVIWKTKNIAGRVIDDWRDYGVQIVVENTRGIESRHRVSRDEIERTNLLDIMARI